MEKKIVLGGREYTVAISNMRKAREWREKFKKELFVLVSAAKAVGAIQIASDAGELDFERIVPALQQLGPAGLDLFEKSAEMVFGYSEVLAADRDWIEENGNDLEMLSALWQVVQMAYPFGYLLDNLPSGLKLSGINGKSPQPSGKRTLKR